MAVATILSIDSFSMVLHANQMLAGLLRSCRNRSIKEVNLELSELQREGFRSKHWSTMRVLRPTAPKIDPALSDEAIDAMSIGELKALIEPYALNLDSQHRMFVVKQF